MEARIRRTHWNPNGYAPGVMSRTAVPVVGFEKIPQRDGLYLRHIRQKRQHRISAAIRL